MVVSTGSYLVNDTMMKLATAGLPPYEVLLLRGAAATLWGVPLLLMLGYARQIPLLFERKVLRRNLFELLAILCYVVALANMQIADSTALGQVTPLDAPQLVGELGMGGSVGLDSSLPARPGFSTARAVTCSDSAMA